MHGEVLSSFNSGERGLEERGVMLCPHGDSLASSFLSIQSSQESQQANAISKNTSEQNAAIAADGSSELWSALVTVDPPSVERRQNTVNIGMSLRDSEANGVEEFVVPASPNSNGTLRPRDFQLLLRGDA